MKSWQILWILWILWILQMLWIFSISNRKKPFTGLDNQMLHHSFTFVLLLRFLFPNIVDINWLLSWCCVSFSFSVILWIFIHFCPAAAALYFLFRNRSGRCGEANWGNLTWTLGPGEGREDHQHKYCLSCLPCPFFDFHVVVFCLLSRLSLYLYFCWSGYDSSKCVKGQKSPFDSVL